MNPIKMKLRIASRGVSVSEDVSKGITAIKIIFVYSCSNG